MTKELCFFVAFTKQIDVNSPEEYKDWYDNQHHKSNVIPEHPHVYFKSHGWVSWYDTVNPYYKEYKRRVKSFISNQDLTACQNYEKRGFKSYHISYIISIMEGFKKGIPIEIIGQPTNIYFSKQEQHKFIAI